jgi:serine protease Do
MKLRLPVLCLVSLIGARALAAAPALAALWQERLKSVVAVEFFTETEIDRRPVQTFGTVIDDQGTVIFPSQAISNRLTPEQLKDFRVYLPGRPTTRFLKAKYLGHDEFTDWEFIRIEDPAARSELVPITHYQVAPTPGVTDELWGIGLRKKDEDFAPYFMSSRVSILQRLPQLTALTAQEVAGLNLPVFDRNGAFVGLTIGGFGQTFLQFSARDRGGLPVVMINPDECAAVVLANEILPWLHRIPQNVQGRPLAWLGANGLQPLDPEVARYLNLEKQAGLVVSEVLDDSPAAAAGLRERDIILSVDGRPLPVLKPDRVLITWFQREVDRRRPGDIMKLGLQRDKQPVDIAVTLADAPLLPREAPRHFFENLGLTVRAFTYSDGVARRVKGAGQPGVIAHFVKLNAPVSVAGLRTDDWIKEIDGEPVASFAEAVKLLTAIENDATRPEFVLLVDRGGETSVLRVKLK